MTASDDGRNEVIECCKRFKLCPNSHVISPTSDRTSLYEAFYNVLEKNLQTFLSDLETQTSTRQSHATKGELNSLIEKVKSRNASVKSPLTKRCLELIEAYVHCIILHVHSQNSFKLITKSFWFVIVLIFSQIKQTWCCWI